MKSVIQKIEISTLKNSGVEWYIKREDLLHPTISGNKFRKLKYNIEKAKERELPILTFGGAFSNHIAATAAAGKEYGIETIGVIRGEEVENPTLNLARENGMKLHFVSRDDYREKEEKWFQNELRNELGNFYLIPEGGSNYLAITGCLEILNNEDDFDYVVSALGTGATFSGIVLSLKEHQKAVGIPVLKGDFLSKEVDKFLYQILMDFDEVEDYKEQSELINDYHFGGYAKWKPELIDFMKLFYKKTGIKTDPVYTGKVAYAIHDLILKSHFPKGSKILMIHTGGLQGISGFENRFKLTIFD